MRTQQNAGVWGTIGWDIEKHKKNLVLRSRNIYDVSGVFPLQQSLQLGSYVKMLVRMVLLDRYRITQEQFQH